MIAVKGITCYMSTDEYCGSRPNKSFGRILLYVIGSEIVFCVNICLYLNGSVISSFNTHAQYSLAIIRIKSYMNAMNNESIIHFHT